MIPKWLHLVSIAAITIILISMPLKESSAHGMKNGGYSWQDSQQEYKLPISRQDAKIIFKRYLEDIGNPNLKPGPVIEAQTHFTADILTKNATLVDQVRIDKETGRIHDRFGMDPGIHNPAHDHIQSEDWDFCHWCGGPINDRTSRIDPGMGPGMGWRHHFQKKIQPSEAPIKKDKARQKIETHLSELHNPNLAVGTVTETLHAFEFEIVTRKSRDLVDVLTVNKYTGRIRSVYE